MEKSTSSRFEVSMVPWGKKNFKTNLQKFFGTLNHGGRSLWGERKMPGRANFLSQNFIYIPLPPVGVGGFAPKERASGGQESLLH